MDARLCKPIREQLREKVCCPLPLTRKELRRQQAMQKAAQRDKED